MSIAAVVCEGIGPSASVAFVIDEGFSIAAPTAVAKTLCSEGFSFGGRVSSILHEGFSGVAGLIEPPIIGKQYADITTLTFQGYSLESGVTGEAVGDAFVFDLQDNSGYNLYANGDGTGYDDAHGDLTRRTFTADVWSVTGQALLGAFVVDINDNPPQIVTPIPPQFNFMLGALLSIDFVNGTPQYVVDPDGDTLTMTLTAGTPPPGTAITGTLLSGFTTTAGTYPVTLTFADTVGESLAVPMVFYIYGTIIMPDLTGQTQVQAAATLIALGLILGNVTSFNTSATIPAGDIMAQSVPAGNVVAFGTTINVTVSLGVIPFPGVTLWQALALLANAGFVPYPVIAYVYSSSVPDNYVVAQYPPAGAMITSSQGVQLTVSMGPPNPTITSTIPNVVGLSLLDAQKRLVAAQCGVGTISWQLGAGPPSVVLSQSPVAGGPVAEWPDVSLVFRSGPSITYPNTGPLTVPNVVMP